MDKFVPIIIIIVKREDIVHTGIITGLPDVTTVEVTIKMDSCNGCSLGKWCNTSESEDDKIRVKVSDSNDYRLGEHVKVTALSGTDIKAIMICLVYPAILFIISVFVGAILFSAIIGCVAGLVALGLYFFVFYKLRNILSKKIKFHIEKDSSNE